MRKLKLEDLAVESFATGAVPELGGTVRGHQDPLQATGNPFAAAAVAGSDFATCQWTCDDDTCGVRCPTGANDPECNKTVTGEEPVTVIGS